VILAREIARAHNIPLNLSSLERKVDTQQQTQLKKNERGQNVRGAFAVTKPGPIEGKKILLIDDVFTTGSTVRECARVLIRNGAKEVAALTVARAIHHNQ
jgi:predicted amidophosphoribosyltransferase